jgi:serine/threonine-protein kinase
MTLSPGARLGRYEVLGPLGAGGMGEVYRARDHGLARDVALKVVTDQLAGDSVALSRFHREAKAVAALSHPNVVAIHDVGVDAEVPFVVMELLEGETLRCRLERAPLAWSETARIGAAIAEGLAAAHAKGLVHRDLKPENVFITSDSRVKLLDFGLARLNPPAASETSSVSPTQTATQPGMPVGTLPYMSPEQLQGRPIDNRSDIFSLGSVLHEMLTGRQPFRGSTAAETMSAILRDDPPVIPETRLDVPLPLASLVRRCLEKRPEERFQAARDIAFGLGALATAPAGSGAARGASARLVRRLVLGALAAAAAIGIAGFVLRARPAAIDSLAVLPFANPSASAETEYLGDGIAESLTNDLAQLPALRVAARSLAFRHRGPNVDPQKAGRELNVRAVLTGEVSRRGEILSVRAELMDVAGGTQLWGNQYNKSPADILEIQAEISRDIGRALRRTLSGRAQERLARRGTANAEAYRAYLKGRFHFLKLTEEDMRKGIESLREAIAVDPGFAAAYGALSEAYLFQVFFVPPADFYPNARAAAQKALELDDELAEGHTALGCVKWLADWDWAGAEKEFKRALELNPDYAPLRDWYGFFLALRGRERHEEAIRHCRRATELEPLFPYYLVDLGEVFRFAGRHDEALEQYRKAIELDQRYWLAHMLLGAALVHKGDFEAGIRELETATRLTDQSQALGTLGWAYAYAGDEGRARAVLAKLEDPSHKGYRDPYGMAVIHAGLEDRDEAFAWLEKALQDRSMFASFIVVDPLLAQLRSDPRFPGLLRRIGLENVAGGSTGSGK